MQRDIAVIENWCLDNGKQLNTKKCSLESFQGEADFFLSNSPIHIAQNQLDLVVTINSSLSWSINSETRLQKNRRAMHFVRRGISSTATAKKN